MLDADYRQRLLGRLSAAVERRARAGAGSPEPADAQAEIEALQRVLWADEQAREGAMDAPGQGRERSSEREQLQGRLRLQLERLESAVPGSPEWDAAKTAVEELQERLAATDPVTEPGDEPEAH
ncbi:MAG TPA: hypothetical protein VF763_12220 [Candidatus Limnocylindrales bacterium]